MHASVETDFKLSNVSESEESDQSRIPLFLNEYLRYESQTNIKL